MNELLEVLFRERSALQLAVYRLEVLRHFMEIHDVPSIDIAVDESRRAFAALREVEEERERRVAQLAGRRMVPISELTLRRLCDTDTEFAPLLLELHTSFLSYTTRLTEAGKRVRQISTEQSRMVTTVFQTVVDNSQDFIGYSTEHGPSPALARPRRMDRVV